MAGRTEPQNGAVGRTLKDDGSDLITILDITIQITGADMATLQRFDDSSDTLELVASRGFSARALGFFGTVYRDTNTSCAVAFTRRMRVFVEEISTSYLYVGTRELALLRADGIAAVQSTPLIDSNGHLWGVLSTHFREVQSECAVDLAPLDRFASQTADSLNGREKWMPPPGEAGRADRGRPT